MMNRIAICAAIAAGFVACQSGNLSRSAPEGYGITPHGLVHRSCVREIKPGEKVNEQGVVTSAGGTRQQLPQCRYPRLHPRTLEPIQSTLSGINGWISAGTWTSRTALGQLGATWTVPAAPQTNGATIFFFPGAQPPTPPTILQPVLQYGSSLAGGGNYWTISSWYCCPVGWTFHGPLENTTASHTLQGSMNAVCSSGFCDWTIVTKDTTTGTTSTLQAEAVTLSFFWQIGAALEAYTLTSCDQFPSSPTTFSNITLVDQNGNTLTPVWFASMWSVSPDCGYTFTSTAPNTITLTY